MDADKRRLIKFKAAAIVAAALIVIVALILSVVSQNKTNTDPHAEIDSIPEAFFDYKIHANIVGGEKLSDSIGPRGNLEMLSRDLYTFGRRAYDAYKNDLSKPVGFKVTSGLTKADDSIVFEGRFGSSQNKVAVELRFLNNKSMDVSITDTVTNFNIDDHLPSNSKINQFIGSLPINGDGYNITFVNADTINIGLYFRDPSLRDRAYQSIIDKLGEEEIKKLNITLSFPSQGF